MNKRAIAILGAIFLLIVGTLGFLIYQRSRKSASTPVTQTPANSQPVSNTQAFQPAPPDNSASNNAGGAKKLTDEAVVSPVLFYQGNGVSYLNTQGQLFQNDLQNANGTITLANKREITIPLKSGIARILWPPSGNNFIAEFNSGGKKTWSFFNGSTAQYADLPTQITTLDWLPGGDKIIYIWLGADGKSVLKTSNADGSGFKTVADIKKDDDQIYVSPDGKSILFHETKNSLAVNSIFLTVPDGQTFKQLIASGYNLGIRWAPDSRKFVYGKKDAATSQYGLWLGDIVSGEIKFLGIATIPEKVVWSSDSQTIYAAVPDKIVQLKLTSDLKQEYDLGSGVDARELFLDNSQSNLFFKNFQDGALYYLNLNNINLPR